MSPGLFVEKLAKILGVPSKSIVVIDRALLEAGLRVRGGRGRSAASVTIADAATLLLTVMATPVLIRADQVVLPWFRVKSWSLPRSAPEPFASMFSSGSPLPLLGLTPGTGGSVAGRGRGKAEGRKVEIRANAILGTQYLTRRRGRQRH